MEFGCIVGQLLERFFVLTVPEGFEQCCESSLLLFPDLVLEMCVGDVYGIVVDE